MNHHAWSHKNFNRKWWAFAKIGWDRNFLRELELVNLSIPQRTTTVVVNYVHICTRPDLTPSPSSPPLPLQHKHSDIATCTHTHRTHIPTLNTSIPHTPPAQTSILIGTNLNYSQAFATIQYKCEQTNYKLDSGKGMHGSEADCDLTPVLVAPRTSLSLKKPLTTVTLQWTHS